MTGCIFNTYSTALIELKKILQKETQPHIPWQKIAAFRNILVHDYLGIDLEVIWQITQYDVPELKTAVESMLQKHHRISS